MNAQQLVPYIGPALVRPNLLWIQPAFLFAITIAMFATTRVEISLRSIALFAGGAMAGGAIGYFRALHQEFSIDPETGNVMSKTTPLGSLLFLAIFLLRYVMNYTMKGGQQTDMVHPPNPTVLLYTDAMLFFALAMVAATAFEVYRRTRPVVAAHQAGQVTPPLP
jgi:hypothetical protein